MTIFEQALSHIATRADFVDGDYYKDNIIYCGKCNTPKETTIKLGSCPETIVRIACKCVMDEEEKEKKQEKVRQRRASIEESMRDLVELGVARMPRFDFSMWDGSNPAIKERMVKYAKNFDQVYDRNIGLILYGNAGTGKTFFSECIADALLKNGRFALLTSVSGLANAMSSNYNESRAKVLHYIKNVDLLVLDDYGTERDTAFMNEHIFDIIDTRYTANRPMVITTNLSPDAMRANMNINVKRIAERLFESCVAIEVKGDTRRVSRANDKIKAFRELTN